MKKIEALKRLIGVKVRLTSHYSVHHHSYESGSPFSYIPIGYLDVSIQKAIYYNENELKDYYKFYDVIKEVDEFLKVERYNSENKLERTDFYDLGVIGHINGDLLK